MSAKTLGFDQRHLYSLALTFYLTPSQPEVVSLVARRRLAASLPLTPARLFACPHQRDQCVLLPRFVPTLPFSPRPLAARLFLPRLLRLRAELKARPVSLSKLHTLTLPITSLELASLVH